MFKIRSLNGKAISNNNGDEIDSKKNGGDDNNNNSGRRFREKLTKLKSRNLAKFKKIARNNILKIRPSFLTSIAKKVFN